MKKQLNLGFTNQYIEDLFKDKNGVNRQKMKFTMFIDLMIPNNYELHPND